MIKQHPPTTALPDDVLALMRRVTELVDLLYWLPRPTEGSLGYLKQAEMASRKRKNSEVVPRSSQPQYAQVTSGEENRTEALPTPTRVRRYKRWLPDTNPKTRKAYGTALMCGHDLDYDPALFENAFPLEETVHLYSDNANIENWSQDITSEDRLIHPSPPREDPS